MEHLPLCKFLIDKAGFQELYFIWSQERAINLSSKSTHTPIRTAGASHSTKKPQGLPPGANGYGYTGHDLRLLQAPVYLRFLLGNTWHLGMICPMFQLVYLDSWVRMMGHEWWCNVGRQHPAWVTNMIIMRCQQHPAASCRQTMPYVLEGFHPSMKETRYNLVWAP